MLNLFCYRDKSEQERSKILLNKQKKNYHRYKENEKQIKNLQQNMVGVWFGK